MLRMDDRALEILGAVELGRISLVVVVVTGAGQQERAGDDPLLPVVLDGQGPAIVGVRPVGGHSSVAVADVAFDPVLHRGFLDVGLDRGAIGDRLRRAPRLEPEPQREHVRVRSDARVFEQVPGAAQIVAAFQDGVALGRATVLQMPCRAHTGDTGAQDDNVEMFSHGDKLSTHCRTGQHTVETFNTV